MTPKDKREAWRPKGLREGREPDPRFTLANERTFLAWIRTSLALIAGAVALETFAGDAIPQVVRLPFVLVLLLLAGLLAVAAFRRWLTLEEAMRHDRPLPVPRAAFLVAVGVAIGAVLLVLTMIVPIGS